jgi:hypothetical protein
MEPKVLPRKAWQILRKVVSSWCFPISTRSSLLVSHGKGGRPLEGVCGLGLVFANAMPQNSNMFGRRPPLGSHAVCLCWCTLLVWPLWCAVFVASLACSSRFFCLVFPCSLFRALRFSLWDSRCTVSDLWQKGHRFGLCDRGAPVPACCCS